MQTPTATGVKIGTSKVADRYGVVPRTIERWEENPDLKFPAPLRINKRKYWDLEKLEAWERLRATTAA
jgi:hypothetical protein